LRLKNVALFVNAQRTINICIGGLKANRDFLTWTKEDVLGWKNIAVQADQWMKTSQPARSGLKMESYADLMNTGVYCYVVPQVLLPGQANAVSLRFLEGVNATDYATTWVTPQLTIFDLLPALRWVTNHSGELGTEGAGDGGLLGPLLIGNSRLHVRIRIYLRV
jgi:hypothetical protein